MNIKSLLGGPVQQQPDQFQSLLGEYYDPRVAKMKWLGGTLQGLGAGLASGEPGAWAQGLTAGGGQAVDDYRNQALLGYKMKQAAEDRQYNRDQEAKTWDYRVGRDQADDAWRQSQAAAEQDRWNKSFGLQQQSASAKEYPSSVREYEFATQNGFTGTYPEFLTLGKSGAGGEYGLNPVWAQDNAGNWKLYQPNKGGGPAAEVQLPPNVRPQPQVSFQDLGTGIQPVTTRGAVPVGPVMPKDLAGAASQKAQGEAQGNAIVAAPKDLQAADNALALVKKIEENPYLERGTGLSSIGNKVWGTGGYDFENLVKQAKSGSFLTAIQTMRGLGALSNSEGDAATAAINRMDTATSEDAFLDAVSDYKTIINQGKARVEKLLSSGQVGPADGASAAPSSLKQKYGLE